MSNFRIRLVESIPEGLVYPAESPSFMSTYDAWQTLINASTSSIDIGALYWSLRSNEVANHSSSAQGEKIFQSLLKYGRHSGHQLRIAQSYPTQGNPNQDTITLAKRGAADVRSVNFPKLLGSGVLHTKVWVADGKHIYLGSANMDWRSLTQVKELGVLIENCSCLAEDIDKIFQVYWQMGAEGAQIPSKWPDNLSTKINAITPLKVNYSAEHAANVYFSVSAERDTSFHTLPLTVACLLLAELAGPDESKGQDTRPRGHPEDHSEGGAVRLHFRHGLLSHFPLQAAHKVSVECIDIVTQWILIRFFVSVMPRRFWPEIDNAIRTAAIDNQVHVRMLISWWNHSRPAEDYFLRSLQDISGSSSSVNVEIVSVPLVGH